MHTPLGPLGTAPFIHLQILYLTAAQTSLTPKHTAFSLWTPLCTVLYNNAPIPLVLSTATLNPLILPLKSTLDLEF